MPSDPHLALVPLLIAEFPRWLDYFVQRGPFTKPAQLACHLKAMQLRGTHVTVAAAARDPHFVEALYETLKAWGLGSRGSDLRALPEFQAALVAATPSLALLEALQSDAEELDVEQTIKAVWRTIEILGVVGNDAQLVAGTKTLHHLLPELVPPMDRAYTQQFFGWHNPQFQYGQEKCFRLAFAALTLVARETAPRRFVGSHPWHSSVSKVLDNALVGLLRAVEDGEAQVQQ